MKNRNVLIAGGVAVVLVGVLLYAFGGFSDSARTGPASVSQSVAGDPSLDDGGSGGPVRRSSGGESGSSRSRLDASGSDAGDVAEASSDQELEAKKKTMKKRRDRTKKRDRSDEEEETAESGKPPVRKAVKIGG